MLCTLVGVTNCASVTISESVDSLENLSPSLFTCPDTVDLRSVREDLRETETARVAAPSVNSQRSADLHRKAQLARASYDMYDAFVETGDPMLAAPDLGVEIEGFIYGEPGPDTERARLRSDGPTFYGFVAIEPDTRRRHVVFRGTSEPAEWARNLQARQVTFPQGGSVHRGFYTIYQSLQLGETGDRSAFLDQLGAGLPPATHTTFIGHSLGGALAAIAAIDATDEAWAADNPDLSLVTFASPRPGDHTFAALAQPLSSKTRVCNVVDIVPGVPVSLPNYDYTHIGDVVALSSFDYGDTLDNTLEERGLQINCWHSMRSYRFMLDPMARTFDLGACLVGDQQ